jgi:integrase
MPKIQLTEDFLSTSLLCPSDKRRIEYCDKHVPGLYVEVRNTSPGEGTWYLRYKDSAGKTCHQRIGRTTDIDLDTARDKAKELRARITLGEDPRLEAKAKQAQMTLATFWPTYYAHAQARKKTSKKDEQLWRIHVRDHFGSRKLTAISKGDVLDFQTQLKAKGLSHSQCNHCIRLLRQMYNLAMDSQRVDSNPARIKLLPEPKAEYYLKGDDLARLLRVLRTDPNRTTCQVFLFLLATGARLNEALNLRWADIDRKRRLWTLSAAGNKSARTRSIPLGKAALDVLEQVGTEGKHERVFVSAKTGEPLKYVHKVWQRLRLKAGLPELKIHALRHSFASYLVSNGRSLYEVQAILGHRSPEVTTRYAHLSADALQQAADVASAVIEQAGVDQAA